MMEARKEAKDACQADKDQFCKDVEKGKIGDCLKQHEADLSADCKAARMKMHKTHKRAEKMSQEASQPAPAAQPAPAQQ